MAAVFDHLGIHFQYPENWTVETEQENEDVEVTVYSPGGGFWSVAVSDEQDPQALADIVVQAMNEEYDELDSEEASDSIGGEELSGYDLNFYCLDLTNTAQVRTFRRGDRTYLLLWQAEDHEFDEISPIFRAITTSLINNR
jgi:hypothetical protein